VVEVRSRDPIAYYQHTECWYEVGTRDQVRAACMARTAEIAADEEAYVAQAAAGAEPMVRPQMERLAYYQRTCPCDDAHILPVRGPYPRLAEARLYESTEHHVYLDHDGGWLGRDGEPPCFVAGTPVATAKGSRAIEDLAVGDEVLSYDPATKRLRPVAIWRVKSRIANQTLRVTLTNGARLELTPNHPVFRLGTDDFRPADELRVGDRVLVFSGSPQGRAVSAVEVAALAPSDAEVAVYNIGVHSPHDYFAAGVLVHNY